MADIALVDGTEPDMHPRVAMIFFRIAAGHARREIHVRAIGEKFRISVQVCYKVQHLIR